LLLLTLYEIGRGREDARLDCGALNQIRRVIEAELALERKLEVAREGAVRDLNVEAFRFQRVRCPVLDILAVPEARIFSL